MPELEDKPSDSNGASSATVDSDQQGIVERTDWQEALDILRKTDPAKADSLTKKIEGYDKLLSKKMTGLSQREREIVQLAETLKASATKPTGQSTGQKLKIIDAQIEAEPDAKVREGLRQLKDAIREESEDRLKELEAKWEKKFQDAENSSRSVARVGLSKEIKALEEVYGEELVEKYKEGIESNSLKYPGSYSPDRWLHTLAEPDELRQALRIRLKRESAVKPNEDKVVDKKPAQPAVASTKPAIDTDKYKGKNPQQTRVGFGKALDDSLSEGLKKLGIVSR